MAWLLIDNSNSRTKFRLAEAGGLLDWRAVLPTPEIDEASLARLSAELGFSHTMLCSVVPAKAALLEKFFGKRGEVHRLSHTSRLDMVFDYPLPHELGADRLANAVALKQIHGAPGIAIDFGTAVTFSVVSSQGKFAGGAIAPGMAAMTAYMAGRTAQLPEIDPEEPRGAVGKSTVEAMRAGAVYGQRGMVREILSKLREEIGGKVPAVATGGGAALVAQALPEIDFVVPDLTLEGLRLVATRTFS